MTSKIKLGDEIKTGKEVFIEPSHLIVTGLTQKAGKTTTIRLKREGEWFQEDYENGCKVAWVVA